MRPRLFTAPFVLAWTLGLVSGLAFFLFIHFPGHLRDLGADEAGIGLIVATTAVAAIVIRPWIGRSLDRRGRRPVILLGAVVHLAAILLYLTGCHLAIRSTILTAPRYAAIWITIFILAPCSVSINAFALMGTAGSFPMRPTASHSS